MKKRTARAVYRSCEIPGASAPQDRAILKIFYPALPGNGDEQRNTGIVPADRDAGPFPLAIILPGINVGPEAYSWLAQILTVQGYIVATYSFVAEEMPGYVSLTPGLDLAAISPDSYGTRPSGNAIAAIIAAVGKESEGGVLEGCIASDQVILVGHSAGGSVALFNANPEWFPQVRGAFAYGAHAGASTALGFAENTILELPGGVPLLLVAGTEDGVIANSAHRYGGPSNRVEETFDRGFTRDQSDSYLVEVKGGNHFSIAWPVDESTGRHFLENKTESDGEAIRQLLADLLIAFMADALGGSTEQMQHFRHHQLVSTFRCR